MDVGLDGADRFLDHQAHAHRSSEVVNLVELARIERRQRVADGPHDDPQAWFAVGRTLGRVGGVKVREPTGRKVVDDGDVVAARKQALDEV